MLGPYKKRLQTVRSELLEIERTAAEVAKSDDPEQQTPVAKLGAGLAGIARILLRVLDSLPE